MIFKKNCNLSSKRMHVNKIIEELHNISPQEYDEDRTEFCTG